MKTPRKINRVYCQKNILIIKQKFVKLKICWERKPAAKYCLPRKTNKSLNIETEEKELESKGVKY